MFDLPAVQAAIRAQGFDGWLLYDFRGSNILAQRIVGLAEKKLSRRWLPWCATNPIPHRPATCWASAIRSSTGLPRRPARWNLFGQKCPTSSCTYMSWGYRRFIPAIRSWTKKQLDAWLKLAVTRLCFIF